MNNVINIIDRQFNFLGQIDNYESFISNKKWHGVGKFELHLNEDTNHADKLVKENIIFATKKKAYVILHREISSVDGKLIVKGLELKSYLSRWLVFPPEGQAYYRVNSNIETIMKEYAQSTLIRKGIENIVVADNQNRGIKTIYQSRYKNLADELEKLSLASGLGWDIALDLDNKRFIFDVLEGRDRTANQDILPPTIFSIEYGNIGEQRLIESKLNYANVAVVAGQGEGADREVTIVGESQGLDAFELFVDARDIDNVNDLPSRGEQKLAEVPEIFTFDSQVLTDKNLIYDEDFHLGDIITIQNSKWNIAADRRITELTEIYESDGFRLDVTFGESLPTIRGVIKQATDTPIAEGGSQGESGAPGADGVGIQYSWNGTKLGVKREDEATYQYVNLVGSQGPEGKEGPRGTQGIPGLDGKSLEFHWDGTQLGVRVGGQSQYQYVNLKGDKGDTGAQGIQGERGPQGLQGIQGLPGKNLEFIWNGAQLGVRQEGQSIYQYVDLKGAKGDKGDKGDAGSTGATGKSIEFIWSGTSLGVRIEGQSTYQYVNLKGDKGDTGAQGIQGPKGDQGIQGPKGDQGLQGLKGDAGPKGDKPKHRWVSATQIQFENPDGTWGEIVNLNPEAILIHQDYFTAAANQEIFNLTKGAYILGTNSVIWYLDGIKQSNDSIIEVTPTQIKIKGGVPNGSTVLVEYIEFTNIAIGLKGDKGDTGAMGPQGPKGEDGYTPVKGVDYFDGAKGEKGLKGDTGAQGIQGPKGDIGPQGERGLQGLPGKDGSDANVTKENVINAIGQDVGTTSNPAFANVYTPSFENFKQNGSLTNKVITPDTTQIAQTPIAPFLWHDIFAFNRVATPSFETSTDGTTWAAGALNSNLFSQKENQAITVLNYATQKAVRWTWNSSRFGWSGGTWLILAFTYVPTAANKTITFESSADGVTWKIRHVSTGSWNQQPVWFYISGYGGDYYLRLTITWNSGNGNILLSSIRLLTSRWGDQGQGRELSFPFDWDANRNIIFPADAKAASFHKSDGTSVSYEGHKHAKSQITDMPTKLSEFENDENYITQSELGDAGYGDMMRSIYDKDNNGKVDIADLADKLSIVDTRSVNSPPSYYFGLGKNMFWEFKYRTSVGNPPANASASGTYAFILTITGWGDSSGGYPVQISVGGKNLAIRQGVSTSAWGSWYVIANMSDVGNKIITSATEPSGLVAGDQWHKEI